MKTAGIRGNRSVVGFPASGSRAGRIFTALAVGAVLAAGSHDAWAGQAAERAVPTNPSDIRTLRALLALQYPDLRQNGAAPSFPATPLPAVTGEPEQRDLKPPAIEGRAGDEPREAGTAG